MRVTQAVSLTGAAFLLIALAGAATARAPLIAAFWPINEMSGTVLNDVSGNGNHGELHGVAWAALGQWQCLFFDGADDEVVVLDSFTLDLVDEFTLEAVINLITTVDGGIISKWGRGVASDSYMLHVNGGRLEARILLNGATEHTVAQSNPILLAGSWVHVAATFDGEALRVYVDYKLEAEVEARGQVRMSNVDVRLGVEEIMSGPGNVLHGYLDKPRISGVALQPSQFVRDEPAPAQRASWGEVKGSYR